MFSASRLIRNLKMFGFEEGGKVGKPKMMVSLGVIPRKCRQSWEQMLFTPSLFYGNQIVSR